MIFYLASERQWIFPSDLAANPGKVLITEEAFPGVAPTVEAIVQKMVGMVNASGSVDVLSIQCHGYSGGLILWGGGVSTANPNQSTTTTDPRTTEKHLTTNNAYKFKPFASCMRKGGQCELHACNVAAAASPSGVWCSSTSGSGYGDNAPQPKENTSSNGMHFLQTLANVLGVTVVAGGRIQTNMIGFNGPTYFAQPAG